MAEKMLIDASHAEETRVVVVRGNRIEEFDFESEHKKQIRGNIYLAKVTRVEPSLQAAFVDYGGNRHGFLAFAEIHPDYYQIPLADRQALLRAEAEEARRDDDIEHVETGTNLGGMSDEDDGSEDEIVSADRGTLEEIVDEAADADPETVETAAAAAEVTSAEADDAPAEEPKPKPKRARRSKKAIAAEAAALEAEASAEQPATEDAPTAPAPVEEISEEADEGRGPDGSMAAMVDTDTISEAPPSERGGRRGHDDDDDDGHVEEKEVIESVGAEDAMEEVPDRQARRPRKQYRIQEVIKRRQILLVQVAKEERGNKGAALTTYLSLAGRYSVLMPNTARGGGISRKITNPQDRKRLKEIAKMLDVPQGMGVILRTAGANRTKVEVKRDFEYLMRLWENVRTLTLSSTAPCLVYEEGSLIKRSIRDLYNKDISEIVVAGEEGYREAKAFMKMLMPSHAKVVQPYRDVHPIFSRSGIEAQLDRMLQPQVTLKSGGYIIINQTEALVAIDVNSGRSTREHSIEDTALQTNLEAAEEVARQLRLRDLAGLIVVDFIDMEEKRNNRAVEKRLKDHLKNDRARIQVGRISHFGLLEMSRQRIRASVLESTTQVCSHCGGTGHVRSQSSLALHVLRGVEEYLLKNTTHNITVRTTPDIALYLLNHKRSTIIDYEARFGVSIIVSADAHVGAQHFAIDRGEAVENPVRIDQLMQFEAIPEDDDDDIVIEDEIDEEDEPVAVEAKVEREQSDDQNGRKRKRRRRRRGGRGDEANGDAGAEGFSAEGAEDDGEEGEEDDEAASAGEGGETTASETGDDRQKRKRRRRGKRGGRRNRDEDVAADAGDAGALSTALTADDGDDDEAAIADEDAVTDVSLTHVETAPEGPKRRSRRGRSAELAEATDETPAETAPAEVAIDEPAEDADLAASDVDQDTGVDSAPPEAAPVDAAPVDAAPVDAAPAEDGQADAEPVPPVTPQTDVAEAAAEDSEAEAAERRVRNNRNLDSIASEPVVRSSTSAAEAAGSDEAEKPKRGGWWQKRGFL